MAVSSSTNATFEGKVTVTGVQISAGTGAPTHAAPKGSLYLRLDGSSTSTRAYICTVATGTWTNITTAA